jgi:hypothetical protein
MTLEMAFTESLLVQKGHFLSSPEKKGTFSLLKKGCGGGHALIAPSSASTVPRIPAILVAQ